MNGATTREREVGGVQRIAGLFLQDAADLGAGVQLVASVRGDRVWNVDGTRVLRDLAAGTDLSDSTFTDRTTSQLTYSLGVRHQIAEWLGWRASMYDAFRTPSMYELYFARFSSKGTVTEANAQLDAERLRGIEGGFDVTPTASLLGRFTLFRNRVTSPIMDVTIGTAGATAQVIDPCGLMPAKQTCGQRRNVPGLLSSGVEAEVEWHPTTMWSVGGGYAFSPTRVIAPGQPVDGNCGDPCRAPHGHVERLVRRTPLGVGVGRSTSHRRPLRRRPQRRTAGRVLAHRTSRQSRHHARSHGASEGGESARQGVPDRPHALRLPRHGRAALDHRGNPGCMVSAW